jgi:hypothetical protein
MKKTLFFSVLSLIVATTFLSSCSKYDEGSKFTLLSKKSRMVNDWHLISQTENNITLNLSGISSHLSLQKDGTAKSTFSYTLLG